MKLTDDWIGWGLGIAAFLLVLVSEAAGIGAGVGGFILLPTGIGVVTIILTFAYTSYKTFSAISSIIIAVCVLSLYFTLPVALNPPPTIQVICQAIGTSTNIVIHDSTTLTIVHTQTQNTTLTEIISRSYSC